MNTVTGKELFKILLGIIGRYKRKYRSELTFFETEKEINSILKEKWKSTEYIKCHLQVSIRIMF
jgi:hypothetical protein